MSYLQNFFANQNRSVSYMNYFTGYSDDATIAQLNKELKDLQKLLMDKEHEYAVKLNMGFTAQYTAAKIKPILAYSNSRSSGTIYFDGMSGMALSECPDEKTCTIYNLDTKSGETIVLTGYAYNLGAVIARHYKYKINSDNTQVKLAIAEEALIPILENRDKTYYSVGGTTVEKPRRWGDMPSRVNATEFINSMYGLSRNYDFTLDDLCEYFSKNPATEVILKTAPDDAMDLLLKTKFTKTGKLSNLLMITDDEYNQCVANQVLKEFLIIKSEMKRYDIENFKTNSELIKFITLARTWQENLDFYNINYGDYSFKSVAWELIRAFTGCDYTYKPYKETFINHYRFGVFCKYIVKDVVDQGFTSLQNFITKLGDYLTMCDRYGSTPIKETSDLLKLHNIMSRNHKLSFSTEQVDSFKSKYTSFTSFMKDNYAVVAPEVPHDLCTEGDSLGHCVAFYVKRVLDDECLVLFLRFKDKLKESLLTLEVKNNAITQAEGLLGRGPTPEELEIIKAFAEDRKYEVALDIN